MLAPNLIHGLATTTFVESASGVAEGGRTGLTAVIAAILFALSLFLSPIFLAIPSFATAPALIVVGFLMLTSILKVNFEDYTEAIPAYVAVIAMPFMYSISEGIAMGIISYVVINLVTGKSRIEISPVPAFREKSVFSVIGLPSLTFKVRADTPP